LKKFQLKTLFAPETTFTIESGNEMEFEILWRGRKKSKSIICAILIERIVIDFSQTGTKYFFPVNMKAWGLRVIFGDWSGDLVFVGELGR
jgi:hypothetical protein